MISQFRPFDTFNIRVSSKARNYLVWSKMVECVDHSRRPTFVLGRAADIQPSSLSCVHDILCICVFYAVVLDKGTLRCYTSISGGFIDRGAICAQVKSRNGGCATRRARWNNNLPSPMWICSLTRSAKHWTSGLGFKNVQRILCSLL